MMIRVCKQKMKKNGGSFCGNNYKIITKLIIKNNLFQVVFFVNMLLRYFQINHLLILLVLLLIIGFYDDVCTLYVPLIYN